MKLLTFILASSMAFAVVSAPMTASAKTVDAVYTSKFSNTAVGGYDAVAYFTQNAPVKGSEDFQTTYDGAVFQFSSQENLDKFNANPAQYAPQYGGYCAWAVAQDKTAKGSPKNWTIVDGKLYLNYNNKIQDKWDANQAEFIKDADKNWPELIAGN